MTAPNNSSEPSDASIEFEDVADEFAEALNSAKPPSINDYVDRFPQFEAEIRDLFPLILRMHVSEPSQGVPLVPFDEPPKRIGEYRIVREIGRGGMGIVYEAVQESLGRKVALKILPPILSSNEKLKARFEREAQAAASLHHTNIVPVFGFGEVDGHHYYAMQYIRGQAASEWLRENHSAQSAKHRRMDSDHGSATGVDDDRSGSSVSGTSRNEGKYRHRRVAAIGQQVAEALAYAHDQGILHRDIKPSNLLIDSHETVWITDFGLAKTLDSADLTESGDVLGTLRYMPPEAFVGKVDHTADIYSLGLTLYEFLLGKPAFEAQSREQLIQNVTAAKVSPLRRLDSSIPRDLETIIARATSSDPKRRFRSAQDMADDLRRIRAGEPIRARQVSATEKTIKWVRRHPAVAALWVCLTIAIISGAAGVIWKWRDAEFAKSELQYALKRNEQSLDRATRALNTSNEITNVMVRLIAASDDYGVSSMLTSSGEIAVPGRSTDQALELTEEQLVNLEDVETRDLLVSQLAIVRIVRGEINEAAELLNTFSAVRQPSSDERTVLAFVQCLQGRYREAQETLQDLIPLNDAEVARKNFLLCYFQMQIDETEENVRAAEVALEKQLSAESSTGKRLNQQFLFHAHLALIRLRRSAIDAKRFAYENSREREHFRKAARALTDVNSSPLYESVFPLGTGLYQQESGWRWNNKLLIGSGRSMANSGIDKLAETFGITNPLRALIMQELGGFFVNMSELHDYPAYLDDAERVFEFALEGAESLCPGEPRTADIQFQLARLLLRQDKQSEAIPLLRVAIATRTRVFGESHPSTLEAQSLLSTVDQSSWRRTFARLINVVPRNYVPYGCRFQDIAFRYEGSNLISYSHLHDRNAGTANFGMVTNWESENGQRIGDFGTTLTSSEYRRRPAMFDATGQRLVLAGADGSIQVVDTKTNKVIALEKSPSFRAEQVAISGDGRRVAAWSNSGSPAVHVWEIGSEQGALKLIASESLSPLSVVSLNTSGNKLAMALASEPGLDGTSPDRVRILDLETEEVFEFEGLTRTAAMEFAPGSDRLAIGSRDGRVQIVSVADRSVLNRSGRDNIFEIGQGSSDVASVATSEPSIVKITAPTELTDLSWSADGSVLVGAGIDAIVVWDAEGQVISELEAPQRFGDLPYEPRVAISGDGTKIAAIQPDHTINIWSSQSPADATLSPIELSLANIERSIEASPSDPWLFCNRGLLLSRSGQLLAAFDDYAAARNLLAGDEPCLLVDDEAFIQTPPLDLDPSDGYTMEAWVKHWNFMQPDFVYGVTAAIGPVNEAQVSALARGENSNLQNIWKLHTNHVATWLRGVGSKRIQDQWVHLAVVFTPRERRYYLDGKQRNKSGQSVTHTELGELYVGTTALQDPIAKGRGLIRSLRVTQGERYSGNFQPNEELESDDATVLLFDFTEARFNDPPTTAISADAELGKSDRHETSAANLRIVPDRSSRRNHGELHNAWWLHQATAD